MNPEELELQRLEELLQQLSPSPPSEQLTSRIFASFETPLDAAPAHIPHIIPMSSKSWSQPFAAAAAVALIAGIIAVIGFNRTDSVVDTEPPKEPVTPTPVHYIPQQAQNTYQGSNVEGIIFTEDHRPMQTVRHQFTDTFIWINPEDGSRVELHVPVESVRYIPVPTN